MARRADPNNAGETPLDPMGLALAEARAAAARGEVPVGAVIVKDGTLVAAISFARIRRLYFGAADPKGGAVENGVRFFAQATCHHAPEVYGGIAESEAARLLREFFAARR